MIGDKDMAYPEVSLIYHKKTKNFQGGYAMCRRNSKTDPVGIDFDPTSFSLDEIAHLGAQKILCMAVKAEVNMHIEQWQHVKDEQVSGLSASTVTRLKNNWKDEYDAWKRRDLSTTRYCYLWVDGIYTNVRFSDNRLCLLVIIGATEDGEKELVAVESGYCESDVLIYAYSKSVKQYRIYRWRRIEKGRINL